jgi:hypothetical protein
MPGAANDLASYLDGDLKKESCFSRILKPPRWFLLFTLNPTWKLCGLDDSKLGCEHVVHIVPLKNLKIRVVTPIRFGDAVPHSSTNH